MYCRLPCPTDHSTCSSLLLTHFDYTNTLKKRSYSPQSNHDQIPATTISRRFRRLEQPIISYASNYYVVHPPHQVSHTPTSSSLDRIRSTSIDKHIYCDLFNLLESSPSIKSRRKPIRNDSNSSRRYRSIVYKNMHTKLKDVNERKRHHSQQTFTNQKEKFDQMQKKQNKSYQRQLSTKGFFRRVVRQYFCMPMTITNGKFSISNLNKS